MAGETPVLNGSAGGGTYEGCGERLLAGVACRFDGRSKPSSEVQRYLDEHECQVVKI